MCLVYIFKDCRIYLCGTKLDLIEDGKREIDPKMVNNVAYSKYFACSLNWHHIFIINQAYVAYPTKHWSVAKKLVSRPIPSQFT